MTDYGAFYNKEAGTKALTTETGAGQWGSALAMASSFFDIGPEAPEMAGEYPDIVIGCAGGGTLRDFAGFAYPFLHQNFTNGKKSRIIAVEPASCPSMTRGKYLFDYGDTPPARQW